MASDRVTLPASEAVCDGYEWRGDVPWKCRLPVGHKGADGTFLGRSCKGSDSADAPVYAPFCRFAPHPDDETVHHRRIKRCDCPCHGGTAPWWSEARP